MCPSSSCTVEREAQPRVLLLRLTVTGHSSAMGHLDPAPAPERRLAEVIQPTHSADEGPKIETDVPESKPQELESQIPEPMGPFCPALSQPPEPAIECTV